MVKMGNWIKTERRRKENRLPAGSVSMAYICHLNDRPGTLNLQACVAQGVPPGPLLGRLKAGEDVTLPDGRVVLSKDVTSAEEPGPVFIGKLFTNVCYFPCLGYMPSFVF